MIWTFLMNRAYPPHHLPPLLDSKTLQEHITYFQKEDQDLRKQLRQARTWLRKPMIGPDQASILELEIEHLKAQLKALQACYKEVLELAQKQQEHTTVTRSLHAKPVEEEPPFHSIVSCASLPPQVSSIKTASPEDSTRPKPEQEQAPACAEEHSSAPAAFLEDCEGMAIIHTRPSGGSIAPSAPPKDSPLVASRRHVVSLRTAKDGEFRPVAPKKGRLQRFARHDSDSEDDMPASTAAAPEEHLMHMKSADSDDAIHEAIPEIHLERQRGRRRL